MKEIRFVDVGEGITEGHIRAWLVKNLDTVKEDQPVVQVETDKAIVNVPAPISGIIKIAAQTGTTVKVGDLVASVGEASEFSSTQQVTPSAQASTGAAPILQPQKSVPQVEKPMATNEILAPPSVRKLARELGIDINRVTGTGPSGRITENDVRNFISKTQKRAIPKFSGTLEEQHKEELTRIPMSQTRKAIARNMELSWTIPRAVHMDLINASSLFALEQREKPRLAELGIKLTFLPFIIKATVEALKEHPYFNSSYDHETSEVILKRYYNLGIAAEAPDGLKVIVIKQADTKSIAQIAKELQVLAEKIKNQTITVEEMSDSTFTITNIGSLGGGFLSVPMINYPEVAILGIQAIKDMPVVVDGKIAIAKMLPFSLAFDHRVVDGADAVKFGSTLIKYIEDPDFLEILG